VVRKVTRDLHEERRDRVRDLANTEAFQRSCREHKKVEMRSAHMKRILKLDRLRLRGLTGVKDEVLLTATAQNLTLLWQIITNGKVIGFPNQFFNDSWVVGLWRADHGENDVGLGSRA
jgi:hypothetical protein